MRNATVVTAVVAVIGACVLGFNGADLSAAPIEFATQAEFDDNFTVMTGASGTIGWNSDGDGGEGLGGFVTATVDNAYGIVVYDTNSAVGGSNDVFGNCTIDVDFRTSDTRGAIGFYFLDSNASGEDRDKKHWVFFNVDDDRENGNERVRFWKGRNIATGGGTQITAAAYDVDTDLTVDRWMHLRLDVELINSGAQVKFTLKGYDSQTVFDATTLELNHSYTAAAGDSHTQTSEVGISLWGCDSDGLDGNDSDFDNFQVVPEPATLALLGIGGIGVLLRRKRK